MLRVRVRTAHAEDDVFRHRLALARVLLRLAPEQLVVWQHYRRGHAPECRPREQRDARPQPLRVHAVTGTNAKQSVV